MSDIKQVIVMRKDLGMRKGKMIAQGCHASMKVFFDMMKEIEDGQARLRNPIVIGYKLCPNEDIMSWMNGPFTKICVSIDSEEGLLDIESKAKEAGLPVALITDAGRTEFDGVPTKTCLAIGPAKSEDIDKITGNLKLL
jgi:PTH2 family peptidyl-tRNA hydrolase